jgi:uncharacterized protein with HEPN domain
MRPDDRQLGLLWDIQDYGNLAIEIASGLTFNQLRASRPDQLALAKALENIGEAAHHLSSAITSLHPEIPWQNIVNLRHRIAHDYRNIDFHIVWDIIQQELPDLLAVVSAHLPAEDEDADEGDTAEP